MGKGHADCGVSLIFSPKWSDVLGDIGGKQRACYKFLERMRL